MALLRIKNLKKSYNITKTQKQEVLKGIDLEFKSGDLVALLGESGCGKSTLINILGGLDMDYTGSIVIKDDFIRDFSDEQIDDYRKKRVGLIFQNYNLIGHSTILENVELAMAISDIDKKIRRERALELLKMVGLGNYPNKYPNQLSGGQKQRVAIARALANNPTIILADEPTGALDSESAEIVMKILKKIAESGKLVIIVTHSQKVADECGRVIKMDEGVIVDDRVTKKLHIDKKRDKEITPKKMKRRDLFSRAFQNIKRNAKRSLLSSVGMAVGIVAMLLILCLSTGLTEYVNDVYGEKGNALELQVYQDNYKTLFDDDIEAINQVGGIYSTRLTTYISEVDAVYEQESYTIGIVDYAEDYVPDIMYGEVPSGNQEILIGINHAMLISPDSIIALIGQTLQVTVDEQTKELTICGVYDDDEDNLCYISTGDLEDFASEFSHKNNYLYITLSDVTYVSAAVSDLGALGYNVTQQENAVEEVLEYIDMGTSVLTAVGAVSMVVSAIMIFIVLYISVTERIKEIGIMRSIGARKKDIKRMFIYEAGFMGLLAGAMAVATTIVLTIIVNLICKSTLSYALISYNVVYYALGIVLSTGVSMLAGIAPAKRGAELDPVECLRAE